MVIDGASSDAGELDGSITFLSPDLQEVLGEIELEQVGIVAATFDRVSSAGRILDVVRVELYVEGVQVVLGGSDR